MRYNICIVLALAIGIGIGWILRGNQQPAITDCVDTVIHVPSYWDGKQFKCVQPVVKCLKRGETK